MIQATANPPLINTELFKIGTQSITLSTIAVLAAVLVVTYGVSRALQAGIRRFLSHRQIAASGSVELAPRLTHYTVMLIGVAVALQTAGIQLNALFAAGAVFAVTIGFAMQNIAQNFVAGMILLLERTIKPGDILEIEHVVVQVQRIGIRATQVRSRDLEEIIVPNSLLVQSTVKNYTLNNSLYRLRVAVGVTYSSDMALVKRTLEQVASDLHWRTPEPRPIVLLIGFGDSSVNFEVSAYTNEPWLARRRQSDMYDAIWWAFKEKEIVIAFPQLDVHFDRPVEDALSALPRAS